MNKLMMYFILCLPVLAYGDPNLPQQPNHAVVCSACHGQNGISLNPEWPNIAGQHSPYLLKQLLAIKENKTREVPSMSALLANMSNEELRELANYYATLPLAQGQTAPEFVARGERLYRGGDFSKHITACIACHGPKGTGNAQAGFPVISGQHAAYTILQLKAFKEGKRSNDLNHIMQDISARMSDEDMAAVAHYIEGLY
ncbi:MAG: c-type cytochrome [Legionella sp.]